MRIKESDLDGYGGYSDNWNDPYVPPGNEYDPSVDANTDLKVHTRSRQMQIIAPVELMIRLQSRFEDDSFFPGYVKAIDESITLMKKHGLHKYLYHGCNIIIGD